ncbi:hypothetical protein U9M48_013695 [Paspalum notatum var. saurae]|uniref:Cation/H+ exchanger transmembrane domain-containing protein n=1 Tax=Paspalum notatum var. saurae TaxID=547442 RepID=A0AAQ3SZV5_PASNO
MALELSLGSLVSASPPAGGALAAPPPPLAPPGKEQQVAGVGILLQISMLVLSFVLGHVLRRHRFYYLPEASASLLIAVSSFDVLLIPTIVTGYGNPVEKWHSLWDFHVRIAGLVVGGLANISNTETNTRFDVVQLSRRILLPVLITPNNIISFFCNLFLTLLIFLRKSLSPKPFFANFGAIVTFAILGTFIASVVTGILVYLGGLTFLMYKLPLVECLMFGALISATDPVTVLSIFQELGSDVNLYALVFGESVLNDAVCFHFFPVHQTMSSVRSHAAAGENFFMMILQFLETFVGSMSSG